MVAGDNRPSRVRAKSVSSAMSAVMVPGRGGYLATAEDCAQAIDLTRSFLQALLDTVGQSLAAGESLRECYARAQAVMQPRFGDWPIYQHVLPFDVSRVYDELSGIEHPRIWTAERDRQLWADCMPQAGKGGGQA
mgnify:CR=1 FL=1